MTAKKITEGEKAPEQQDIGPEPRVAFFSGNDEREDAVSGQIIIVCRQPGLRRAGIEHPAVAVYASEAFTSEQVRRLKAEPLLEVLGVL
ncbi:hypothetical protein HKD24_06190 [Gluconobacter sp. LMG 31484]|uniref:Mu-like prophage FluMu N-terminal domain-containing protein n=1 Tax=Gluconobacter vitians TaxID=2728102 RepID=A0ABR9Y4L7_9PROT|nr:HI1506-related protein [Gluconobacter vitians]MBF0858802.1 hypothetical protein [Gluconobacter vitians]